MADEVALMVKATEPEPGEATVLAPNAAVTPAGRPVTDKVTADCREELAAVVTIACEVLPTSTVSELGETLTESDALAEPVVQLLTKRFASTDPRPEARS